MHDLEPAAMSDEMSRGVVTQLWQAMERRDWTSVAALLADDFICEWPVSNERIHGRDNYVAVNRDYPGDWHVSIGRIVADGDRAASEVFVRINSETHVALSFYELRGGTIVREIDYWPEPYPAPAWRAPWTELMTRDV